MKVGLLQLNPTIGDYAGNVSRLLHAYNNACALGAQFVVAPEMFLCGYPPRDLLLRDDFIAENLEALRSTAKSIGEVPLCVGYVDRNLERPGKALRNSAAILHRQKIVQHTHKSLLPTYDVFDEDRYFEPYTKVSLFPYRGHQIGITICEDIWNDEDFWPARLYRRDPVKEIIDWGADLIINLSASPWQVGKEYTRIAMLQKVAKDESVPLVQVNMVGGNDELIFDGHSIVLNQKGEILARGKSFAEDILVVDLENTPPLNPCPWPSKEEQLYAALSLGIRDYVQKCGFQSVALGLSGGIDSALVAALAVNALGSQNVWGIAMPSQYSSSGSLQDAEALAKKLGIRYDVIPIQESFHVLEKQFQPFFSGKPSDLTEENMQSRLRGLILMSLSNKFGSLILTTGNKSELAVGYCTLYGDMCGALAVISDLFKTEVYDLARWINRYEEIIPTSSITKAPSAELRPNQTDQDSLPDYATLDAILKAYVVDDLSQKEIVTQGFSETLVHEIIRKVTLSEYKRRQAAPGLKVSPRAFGVGRRIPIAQRFQR